MTTDVPAHRTAKQVENTATETMNNGQKLPPGAKKKRNKNRKKNKKRLPAADAKQSPQRSSNHDHSESFSRSPSRGSSASRSSGGESSCSESEDEEEGRDGYKQGGYHPVKVRYSATHVAIVQNVCLSVLTHLPSDLLFGGNQANLFSTLRLGKCTMVVSK